NRRDTHRSKPWLSFGSTCSRQGRNRIQLWWPVGTCLGACDGSTRVRLEANSRSDWRVLSARGLCFHSSACVRYGGCGRELSSASRSPEGGNETRRKAGLPTASGPIADGVFRTGLSVHEHVGRRAPRNSILAMALVHVHIHDSACLCRKFCGVPRW